MPVLKEKMKEKQAIVSTARYSSIGNELSTTGILDIVGTILFIFPAIGLFFPGAKTLDRQNVAIDLVPVEQ